MRTSIHTRDDSLLQRLRFLLFRAASRLGTITWVTITSVVFLWLWMYTARAWQLAPATLQLTLIPTVGMILLCVTGIKYYPRQGAPIYLGAGLFPRQVGIHISKEFPTMSQLKSMLASSVQIAGAIHARSVSIRSPLFVRAGRLDRWGQAIRKVLHGSGCAHAQVELVSSQRTPLPSAVLFEAVRRFKKYDVKDKHLPNGDQRHHSAGFIIRLRN